MTGRFMCSAVFAAQLLAQESHAIRFRENPLISTTSSKSLGDNINGPSVIRVPEWINHPLGRYYMYFAHHKGSYIRLAYANSLRGPWRIYEPGVLDVRDTIFNRPQPDPPLSNFYTHVASPEVFIDEQNRQLLMYVHGLWTDQQRLPSDADAASKWMQTKGYAQFTQAMVSRDGIHFQGRPLVALKTSYLRVFQWKGTTYGMARLGLLARAKTPAGPFELGPNPFDGTTYAQRVRHVALLVKNDTLYVFFSAIGDTPERILFTTIALNDDWSQWSVSPPVEILAPREWYECVQLPAVASKVGESEGSERALRDPALFAENNKLFLFYSVCGEQGIGGAEIISLIPSLGPRK